MFGSLSAILLISLEIVLVIYAKKSGTKIKRYTRDQNLIVSYGELVISLVAIFSVVWTKNAIIPPPQVILNVYEVIISVINCL